MTKEEPSVFRGKGQKEEIFSALNGIFQLPDSIIEAEFLKAARVMADRGFGENCMEFVLERIDKFGESRGARILERVNEILEGKGNPVRDSHEARTSEIRFKGPGPATVEAPTRLRVVRSG
jgi:hypothetical protein